MCTWFWICVGLYAAGYSTTWLYLNSDPSDIQERWIRVLLSSLWFLVLVYVLCETIDVLIKVPAAVTASLVLDVEADDTTAAAEKALARAPNEVFGSGRCAEYEASFVEVDET